MPSDELRHALEQVLARICGTETDRVIDAVLAAIRQDHVIVARPGEDVLERAIHEATIATFGLKHGVAVVDKAVETAAPWIRAAALDEAAKVIENGQETFSSGRDGDLRHLTPRVRGNLAGLSYADAIRALISGQEGGR